jgi:hypothetical protein
LQGVVDRVQWSIGGQPSSIGGMKQIETDDILELRIPTGFNIEEMGVVERFSKGRVLLSFPNE